MSMTYKTLKQLFYEDTSESRFENNTREAERRINDLSAYRTGIYLKTGELFYTLPQELALLNERVLRLERRVSQLWRNLPHLARRSYIRDLIVQEIDYTNKIEGVRSTRKEIEDALASIELREESRAEKRFKEFAALYLNITKGEMSFPKEPADIRKIYDAVLAGELTDEDKLDGTLFRAGSVEVSAGTRIVHEGVVPEAKIISMLQAMIDMASDENAPAVYNALLSHFLFEYIHPFYDGNGRTGRFLLALYLSKPLSIPSVLSLSRVVAENLQDYYRAFEEVEHSLNHGDATHFLIVMMRMLRLSQENLVVELEKKDALLTKSWDTLDHLDFLGGQVARKEDGKLILYALLQTHLFASTPMMSLANLSEHIGRSKATTRRYLRSLEDSGLVKIVLQRPLYFSLTDAAYLSLVSDDSLKLASF